MPTGYVDKVVARNCILWIWMLLEIEWNYPSAYFLHDPKLRILLPQFDLQNCRQQPRPHLELHSLAWTLPTNGQPDPSRRLSYCPALRTNVSPPPRWTAQNECQGFSWWLFSRLVKFSGNIIQNILLMNICTPMHARREDDSDCFVTNLSLGFNLSRCIKFLSCLIKEYKRKTIML